MKHFNINSVLTYVIRSLLPSEVQYLSDKDNDYKILEMYLEKILGRNTDYVAEIEKAKQREVVSVHICETSLRMSGINPFKLIYNIIVFILVRRKHKTVATRYDHYNNYLIAQQVVQRVFAGARSFKAENFNYPIYATSPGYSTGAIAGKLSGCSKPAILFDANFMLFCHLFSKAFLEFAEINPSFIRSTSLSTEFISLKLDGNDDKVMYRFVDIFFCQCVEGNIQASEPWWISKTRGSTVEIVRSEMELFVASHEFSHINLDHLSDHSFFKKISSQMGERDKSFSEISDVHLDELHADLLGIELTLRTLKIEGDIHEVQFRFMGIYLYFIACSLEARTNHFLVYENLDNYRDGFSESHPSYTLRKFSIRKFVEDTTQDRNLRLHYRYMFKILDHFEEKLWDNLIVRFELFLLENRGKLNKNSIEKVLSKYGLAQARSPK